MALPTERILLISVFLLVFLAFMVYGLDLCKKDAKEGFTNPVEQSEAPTRASDCQCLPGYIPANKQASLGQFYKILDGNNGDRGIYLTYVSPSDSSTHNIVRIARNQQEFEMIENPTGKFCKIATSACGKNFCTLPTTTVQLESILDKFRSGELKATFLQKDSDICNIANSKSNIPETFFCQSLSDPAQTRSCY